MFLIPDNLSETRKKVKDIFNEKKNFRHPNNKVAKFLSVLIPGAGQIYSNDLKNGINSLALNSAILYGGYLISIRYSLLDAVITVFPWFIRYYKGGYKNAEIIANKRFSMKKEKTLKQLLEIIK